MKRLDVAHFRARVLQDALTEGTAAYWERRAAQWDAVRPRPGDFTGKATPEDLEALDRRAAATAAACRAKATVTADSRPEPITDEVLTALEEAA